MRPGTREWQPPLNAVSCWSSSSLSLGAAGLSDTDLSKQLPLHTVYSCTLRTNCFQHAVDQLQHASEVKINCFEQAGTSASDKLMNAFDHLLWAGTNLYVPPAAAT